MENSDQVSVRVVSGAEAKPVIDAFYQRCASKHLARDSDIFFLALVDEQVVGAVRFCVEFKTPLLRSMMIDEKFRQRGIGRKLLKAFETYLDDRGIQETYCIPYSHLAQFYGQIGFRLTNEVEAPVFLQERLIEYRNLPKTFVCMRRGP